MPGKTGLAKTEQEKQIEQWEKEKIEKMLKNRPKTIIGIAIKNGSFKVKEIAEHGQTKFLEITINN